MEFIKGTSHECIEYVNLVTNGEAYNLSTQKWADPIEVEGFYYVQKHPDYPTNLEVLNSIPSTL